MLSFFLCHQRDRISDQYSHLFIRQLILNHILLYFCFVMISYYFPVHWVKPSPPPTFRKVFPFPWIRVCSFYSPLIESLFKFSVSHEVCFSGSSVYGRPVVITPCLLSFVLGPVCSKTQSIIPQTEIRLLLLLDTGTRSPVTINPRGRDWEYWTLFTGRLYTVRNPWRYCRILKRLCREKSSK